VVGGKGPGLQDEAGTSDGGAYVPQCDATGLYLPAARWGAKGGGRGLRTGSQYERVRRGESPALRGTCQQPSYRFNPPIGRHALMKARERDPVALL